MRQPYRPTYFNFNFLSRPRSTPTEIYLLSTMLQRRVTKTHNRTDTCTHACTDTRTHTQTPHPPTHTHTTLAVSSTRYPRVITLASYCLFCAI